MSARRQKRGTASVDRRSPVRPPEPAMLAALRCLDELLANAVARWHAVQGADPFRGDGWAHRRFDLAVARRIERNPPDVVHGFEGFALESFRVARSRGS